MQPTSNRGQEPFVHTSFGNFTTPKGREIIINGGRQVLAVRQLLSWQAFGVGLPVPSDPDQIIEESFEFTRWVETHSFSHLTELDVSSIELEFIPSELGKLTNLTSLKATVSNLFDLNQTLPAFRNLIKLTNLEIKGPKTSKDCTESTADTMSAGNS